MARRSRMTALKRQRELRKSEKAARKRARRHGILEPGLSEPRANFGFLSEPGTEGTDPEGASSPAEDKDEG